MVQNKSLLHKNHEKWTALPKKEHLLTRKVIFKQAGNPILKDQHAKHYILLHNIQSLIWKLTIRYDRRDKIPNELPARKARKIGKRNPKTDELENYHYGYVMHSTLASMTQVKKD